MTTTKVDAIDTPNVMLVKLSPAVNDNKNIINAF